jgi:hypothetical protein
MEKVIRDGKVAIIYHPSFGAGWYTWNERGDFNEINPDKYKGMIYHPLIVEKIETNKQSEITEEWVKSILGYENDKGHLCVLAAGELEIKWLPVGTRFKIHEYDGSEDIWIYSDLTEEA